MEVKPKLNQVLRGKKNLVRNLNGLVGWPWAWRLVVLLTLWYWRNQTFSWTRLGNELIQTRSHRIRKCWCESRRVQVALLQGWIMRHTSANFTYCRAYVRPHHLCCHASLKPRGFLDARRVSGELGWFIRLSSLFGIMKQHLMSSRRSYISPGWWRLQGFGF